MNGSGYSGGVTGAILAGGRARRFGGANKALLKVGGERILERQLAALGAVTATQVVIANDDAAFGDFGIPVLPDAIAGAGPMGGLYTALMAAATPRVLVLACDLPFVHAAFLRFLIDRAPEADAVVPRTNDGWHPLCAVYARRLLPTVEVHLERRRLSLVGLLEEVDATVVAPEDLAPFDSDGRLLMNVNTAADYRAACGEGRRRGRHDLREPW